MIDPSSHKYVYMCAIENLLNDPKRVSRGYKTTLLSPFGFVPFVPNLVRLKIFPVYPCSLPYERIAYKIEPRVWFRSADKYDKIQITRLNIIKPM